MKLLKIIFSPILLITILIILQLALIISVFYWFNDYFSFMHIVSISLAIIISVYIISKKETPEFKLPWLIIMILLPLLGVILYSMFGENKMTYRMKKKHNEIMKQNDKFFKKEITKLTESEKQFNNDNEYAKYITNTTDLYAYSNTKSDFFSIGEEFYASLLEDLKSAQKFIFLEYFIIDQESKMWKEILNILLKKVSQNIKVRVLYDDIGCLGRVDFTYSKKLRKMGIECYKFRPFIPIVSGFHNNRDHRKIAIIDGQIGYTGGINIGDNYINEIHPLGHWKDTAVRLEGKAVNNLTLLFLQNFDSMANVTENFEDYLIAKSEEGFSKGYVQPFGDGPKPLYRKQIAEDNYLNIINSSKKTLYISTPYLIIDYELENALKRAALRGVDVRIITPHIPDKKIIFAITRSSFTDLLSAGVKIYEYTPGFIHSKVFVSDSKTAICGTINLDYRSLVHHYECGVMLYDTDSIINIENDFNSMFKVCMEIPVNFHFNIFSKVLCKFLAIFTPLL